MSRYTKEDVQSSYHQGHSGSPMANVKVYASIDKGWKDIEKYGEPQDKDFTPEWVEENVSEESLDRIFWLQCEWGWEQLQDEAEEVFGKYAKVYAAGRSGGWCVVEGLDDIESWDAVALAKWRKFERIARLYADDIPYQTLSSIYFNEFEVKKEQEREEWLEAEPQDIAEVIGTVASSTE